MKRIFVLFVVLAAFWGGIWVTAKAQKMTAEDIIAKSLDAIGTSSDRAKITNITIIGESAFAQGSSTAEMSPGKCALASEGNKSLFAMTFTIPLYPLEKIIYDGKNVDVAYGRPGVRSGLGEFMADYQGIIKDGLVGGVLLNGWSFYDIGSRNVKVSYEGTKKVDGREVYALSYAPKKGSDARIRVYFEKDTFRHVRTEYRVSSSAQMGADPNMSAAQSENRKELTEDYSDFKTENGLTLPHTYKLHYYKQENHASREYFYTLTLKDFYFNTKLEASTFDINAK